MLIFYVQGSLGCLENPGQVFAEREKAFDTVDQHQMISASLMRIMDIPQ